MNKKSGRRVLGLLAIVLVIAFAVVAINAQVECVGVCEQNLAQCIRNQGNGGSLSASCIETFEACVEACLGEAGAILG
jgi:hypothetical protein